MRQARGHRLPHCYFELCRLKVILEPQNNGQMTRVLHAVAISCFAIGWCFTSVLAAQEPKPGSSAGNGAGIAEGKAVALAEQGRCKEALPSLKRLLAGQAPAEDRKKAGIAGLRC